MCQSKFPRKKYTAQLSVSLLLRRCHKIRQTIQWKTTQKNFEFNLRYLLCNTYVHPVALIILTIIGSIRTIVQFGIQNWFKLFTKKLAICSVTHQLRLTFSRNSNVLRQNVSGVAKTTQNYSPTRMYADPCNTRVIQRDT